MPLITMELPDEVMICLKESPEELGRELRLAAAMKLYELGKLSSGRAAQLAGIARVAFLELTAQYRVPAFRLTEDELRQDTANA